MRMLVELLRAALFGIVEGLTEWLPVSSTAHMQLLQRLLPFRGVSENFYATFEVVIQLGAILAVILLFWQKIWPLRKKSGGGVQVRMPVILLWLKVIVACLPLPIIKVLDLDERIAGSNLTAIAIALIVVGALFILVENLRAGKRPTVRSLSKLPWTTALIIGLCQAVAAIFPGVSRSGATIIGALLLGVSRSVAVEFTFIMAIPVMLGASLFDLMDGFALAGSEIALLLVGTAVAFVVSMIVIRPLLDYIKKHDFRGFGLYRIALGVIVLVLSLVLH